MTVTQESLAPSKILLEAAAVLFMLAAAAVLLYIPRDQADLNFDSSAYAAQSINLAGGRGNTMRMGGEDIPGFYPPGYPALTVPFHWILGSHLQNGVTANFFLGLLTLLGVYFIGRRVAGPAAGAAALLFLLASPVFIHVAQRIFSQMPSLLGVAIMVILLLRGWREGRASGFCRFAAGFLCGITVMIRTNNVVLAPALAILPLVHPPAGRRRLEGALALWTGIAASVALVAAYNVATYGSPLATGYMSWGFTLERTFSLEYIFDPPYIQLDEKPFQLVRSLLGFSLLYTWPVAALAVSGCIAAIVVRRKRPAFFNLSLVTVLSSLFLYGFLALYFFRTPVYTMLTLPMILPLAAAAAVLFLEKAENSTRLKRIPLRWIPAAAAGLCLVPLFGNAALFGGKGKHNVPAEVDAFQNADALLEQDAVLLGAANPLVAEYLFRQETSRRYVFLNRRKEEQFKRLVRSELGKAPLTLPLVQGYVDRRLEEGLGVYLLIYPFEAKEGFLLDETYKFLKKRFHLEETRYPGLLRIRIGSAPGREGR